jgi:hypothetical protein
MSWFRIRPQGIRELQNELSAGLEAVGDKVYDVAYGLAPVETTRDPAYTRDTLHVDKTHSREWPRPAVFVATASGDGFFVHEGTVDTPPHPFLSQALDAVRRDIPGIMRRKSKGSEYGIHRT